MFSTSQVPYRCMGGGGIWLRAPFFGSDGLKSLARDNRDYVHFICNGHVVLR